MIPIVLAKTKCVGMYRLQDMNWVISIISQIKYSLFCSKLTWHNVNNKIHNNNLNLKFPLLRTLNRHFRKSSQVQKGCRIKDKTLYFRAFGDTFSLLFEREAPHFHSTLSPTKYVSGTALRERGREQFVPVTWAGKGNICLWSSRNEIRWKPVAWGGAHVPWLWRTVLILDRKWHFFPLTAFPQKCSLILFVHICVHVPSRKPLLPQKQWSKREGHCM